MAGARGFLALHFSPFHSLFLSVASTDALCNARNGISKFFLWHVVSFPVSRGVWRILTESKKTIAYTWSLLDFS